MELTQRLECTQELFNSKNVKVSPEQIGFLGIYGTKYPIKKGPNKIGRDPESCNIVINLNSISRQHAVINILNSHDFMLMDLDSANKTKLSGKTLQAYIPYPLENGDMVQFGEVFGMFRLFEEKNDLPMTQAIEIPETPAPTRHVSKLNNIHTTTIPESPDVSDRDDSFIASSQHKARNVFRSPNNNFLISSGKTIAIKPVGNNIIDNAYWSSSKKSDSFTIQSDISSNLNDSTTLTKSHTNIAKQSIHELNTQVLYSDIETLQTNNNANTDIVENAPSPNIYDMETQIYTERVIQNLPEVLKIKDQQNLAFNLHADNKENDNNIFNADTQVTGDVKSGSLRGTEYLNNEQSKVSTSQDSHNVSDDVIFDEIDSQPIQDDFYSQPLLSPKLNLASNEKQPKSEVTEKNNFVSRTSQLKSDSGADGDDIFMVMTQEIPKATYIDENSTDCEDEPNPTLKPNKNPKNFPSDDDVTDCEDELNENDVIQPNKPLHDDGFEDLPTQILEDARVDESHEVIDTKSLINENSNLEKTPKQIVDHKNESLKICKGKITIENVSKKQFHAESQKNTDFAEALTQQIYSEEIVRFKVPFQSPIKKKKSYDTNTNINKCPTITVTVDDDDDQYYNATQELFNDLCSQRTLSPDVEIVNISTKKTSDKNELMYKKQCQKLETRISSQESSDANDVEERINNFVSNLSHSQICEVVGVQKDLNINKKVLSDTSDLEMTPKKINCRAILDTDLPNTQEIKKNATLYTPNTSDTESLCDSNESESNNERDIPKSLHQKPKRNIKVKINLSDKFDPASLPVRSSSRLKKPTKKLQNIKSLTKTCEYVPKPRSHKKQQGEIVKINKDNKKVTEKSNESKHKISDKNCSKNNIKNYLTSQKNDKKDKKVDEKEDNEVSRSKMLKDNRIDKTKQKDKTNTNKEKVKSVETVTKERTNEKDSATDTVRKTRSHKTNNTHNTSDKDKSQCDNKSKRKENSKPIKEKARSPEKETSVPVLKSIMKPSRDIETRDTEVRRSRRNRSGNKSDSSSSSIPKTRSTNHEQSAIDSPNRLKRSATKEIDMTNVKKSKTGNYENTSYRTTPARKVRTHYVLFTAFSNEEVKQKLESLGAIVVSDVRTCTMVLTIQIKRTAKLLCAVGLGKPIVGPNWIQACVDTNMIVDPWLYLIYDEATEKRLQFNLQRTLVGKRDFLQGYNVSATPSVMPTAAEMKLIVECSGGNWKEGPPNWICVSVPADISLWAGLKKKGAIVVSPEFILGGALRQKLDIDRNKLI